VSLKHVDALMIPVIVLGINDLNAGPDGNYVCNEVTWFSVM